MTDKVCTKCGDSKPRTEFHRHRQTLDGLQSWCKSCTKAAGLVYKRSPRGKRKNWEHGLKRFYGITALQYDILYQQCGGKCPACGTDAELLHVDHDHATGRVRGLLCGNCNRALGLLGENAETLRRLVAYIEMPYGQ